MLTKQIAPDPPTGCTIEHLFNQLGSLGFAKESTRASGMDMMVQYEQEPSLAAMDTTPITPSMSVRMMPPFMSTLSTSIPDLAHPGNILLPEPDMSYMLDATKADIASNSVVASMHLPISPPEMLMSDFLNPSMDTMEAPQQLLPSPPTTFVPDMRTVHLDPFGMMPSLEKLDFSPDARTLSVSPPQSQVPSPGIHGTASSYGAGVLSSLDVALDSAVVGGRSRANTSLSPPAPSPPNFPSLLPPSMQGTVVDYPSNDSNSSQDESGSPAQPRAVIGKMLKEYVASNIFIGLH